MQLKSVLIVLIIGAVYLHQCEAAPKLGLIKAKVALAKAPHIIAKVSVAKEVKAKTKIAFAKTLAAAKATKVAAISAITAPFRAAKRTIALKVGAVKIAKAAKLAKIAKAATILKNLKKGPIILPVPVAVPIKAPFPLPLPVKSLPAPSLPTLFNIPPPSLSSSLGPIRDIISGAQRVLQTAGSGIPLLSTFTNNHAPINTKTVKEIVPIVTPAPVYRFVPEVGFSNYNKVSYQPQVNVEVPAIPASTYGLPPPTPARTYGLPN